MAQMISSDELKSWLDSGKEFLLVDVLPEEYFEEKHLPQAKNASVYETTFIERVGSLAPDKGIPIVVYGSGARSNASVAAANKLAEFGYTEVLHFPGGTEEWQKRRFPIEGDQADGAQSAVEHIALPLDVRRSKALWIDRSIDDDQHFGTMKVLDGHIELGDGAVTGGRFLIDMTSLQCTDITSENQNRSMVDQMKSKEFFDVVHHPTAELYLAKVVARDGSPDEDLNADIFANLTIKGLTGELEFSAQIGTLEGGALVFQAHFDIDRDKWPSVYGAEGTADIIAGRLADDYITMQLSVFTLPLE